VDPIRIAGAMVANIKAGHIVQGGSTITQQLVGLAFLDRTEKSYTRKIKEAVLAMRIEKECSKDEIITHYMNRAYYGGGAYGIEAAAEYFFAIFFSIKLFKSAFSPSILPSAIPSCFIIIRSSHVCIYFTSVFSFLWFISSSPLLYRYNTCKEELFSFMHMITQNLYIYQYIPLSSFIRHVFICFL